MTQLWTYTDIAKMIDHSLLSPSLTTQELEEGCALALRYNTASVCIMPYALRRCADLLANSTVKSSTTIGFPHGGHATAIKLAEAQQALADGGQELDAVINISKARSGDWHYVEDEIAGLTTLIHDGGAKIKVIFENAYHDDAAKIRLCEICGEIGVDWVKTSTGYAATGATTADLELMRRTHAGAGSSEGRWRHPRSGRTACCPHNRREPRWRHAHTGDAGGVPPPAGPRTDHADRAGDRACRVLNQ